MNVFICDLERTYNTSKFKSGTVAHYPFVVSYQIYESLVSY